MSLLEKTKKEMTDAIGHLKDELKKIRTGHANPAMVEDVFVEVYGTKMRLKDMATITSPENRQLLITPFDKQNANVIGKAIEKANLGFSPIVDANSVRINIPQMDASVRNEMVKLCHKKREEAKISIRNIRRDANEAVRKQKSDGDIGEDIMKKSEKTIQEYTDQYCKEADEVTSRKEKDVSQV